MTRKRLTLTPVSTGATLTTKFGGRPVWAHKPEWPCSRATGKPMLFLGQVEIDPGLFACPPGRFAYLFMSAWSESTMLDGATWSPDASHPMD